jgi:hypothetical protein
MRNGPLAVLLAEGACQSAPDPARLDLLAAAYAEAGRFDNAIAAASQAQQAAEDSRQQQLAQQIAGRLQLYREHRPYRRGP